MPFTPFHMGPGIFIKALLQGSFSLMVFGWAQIVMDIQPLLVMLSGEGHLHGFSHTFVGAMLLAILAATTGKYLALVGLYCFGLNQDWKVSITWPVALMSAVIGTFSHVLLDAVMHSDVQPWAPLHLHNAYLGWLSSEQLHLFCIATGVVGGIVYAILRTKTVRGREDSK
ncbi:hypothetical protein [Marinagarivorans algicola]|uniref:hypothetical protein n=1 Tax=Marinagarivorans algicola TaxID=1513270 RepID=UPI00373679F5